MTPINIDPVKLCCGHRQSEHNGAECPTGMFMCQSCFDTFFPHQAKTDEDGQKWDICLNCEAHEKFILDVCIWVDALEKANG